MLLYKGSRNQFLTPLQAVSGIVEKRHTLPILSNVLIENENGKLMLLSTDIEMQIKTSTTSGSNEKIAITVAARKLQDILRSLPEDSEITLNVDDRRLQLTTGKSRFNIQTLPEEDFPRMTEIAGQATEIGLTQKQFKRQLNLVQYAMAQQDIRYYLNGLLLIARNGELVLVATDGHRLAFANESINEFTNGSDDFIEAILPRKTIFELSRQLADNDEELLITLAPTQARISFSGIEFVSKLIDGKFPDYERVIPKNQSNVIVIDHKVFQNSLQRVAILTNEKFRGVRFIISPGSMKIMSTNAENEEAHEEIEIEYDGSEIDVGFNVNYLLDVLNNVSCEKIIIKLDGGNSSALLMLPDNEKFKYVVMPMRI